MGNLAIVLQEAGALAAFAAQSFEDFLLSRDDAAFAQDEDECDAHGDFLEEVVG